MLVKPSITAVLPPCSFHVFNISFLALVDGSIILLNPSLIAVKNSAACSLSPIIYSHDVAQPEPTDSFMVSINWVNVLTSVAAFNRLSSSANCSNVLIRTSDVNQLSWSVSLNGLDSLTYIPICLAVSFNAFWNSSPPIPAFTTEFQSCNPTLPAANA